MDDPCKGILWSDLFRFAPKAQGDTVQILIMAHRVAPGKARDEVEFALKYRQPPAFVSSEQHTLWHAWVGGIEAKPLRFDARTGTLTVALRCTEDATLPTHRHKGVATAVTIKGSWKFDELSDIPISPE